MEEGRGGGILRDRIRPVGSSARRPEEVDQVLIDHLLEARHERVEAGVGPDLGRVGEELLPPDETRLLAELDHILEEAAEDSQPIPLADLGQTGVVGQALAEVVAEVPA